MTSEEFNDSFALRASFSQRASMAILRRFSNAGSGGDLRQGTVMGITLNTLCNVMGAGILSLPSAMYHASVGVGMFLLVLCAAASVAASYFVACGCDATGKESFAEVLAFSLWPEKKLTHNRRRYAQVDAAEMEQQEAELHKREAARRRRNRQRVLVILELIVFLNNFGALIIYSRVIADSIPPVIETFLDGTGIWVDKNTWLLLSGVVFFALSCVRSMEELKWTSLVGFVTILYVVVIVIMRFVTMTDVRPSMSSIRWFSFGGDTLRAMSSYGVAFGYHYNVPYFYKELHDRTPGKFMRSVAIAFPIIFVSYAATGLLGYFTFGDAVATQGGDVINNYAKDDSVVNVGRLGLFFHFACVFPVLSVCARRGLHRLIMIAVQHIVGFAAFAKSQWTTFLTSPSSSSSSTLLPKGNNNHYGTRESPLDASSPVEDDPENKVGDPNNNNNNGVAQKRHHPDVDDDPGRPEDTTRFAIIVEALIIVTLSVFLAGVVSGIDVVIDIIGTLFGLTLMLVVPGLIGVCTFAYSANAALVDGGSENGREFSYFTSVTRNFESVSPKMTLLSWVVFVMGIFFVLCGGVMTIINHARDG